MATTREMLRNKRLQIALAVVVALVAVSVAYLVGLAAAGPDPCTPETRQAALESDSSAVLAGSISLTEAVNRESARMERCGD